MLITTNKCDLNNIHIYTVKIFDFLNKIFVLISYLDFIVPLQEVFNKNDKMKVTSTGFFSNNVSTLKMMFS